MPKSVIESVIEITRHRDIDSLEYSLVATLAEMLPAHHISMSKIGTTTHFSKVEEVVCFESAVNESGKPFYTWNKDPVLIDIDEDVKQCISVNHAMFLTASYKDDPVFRHIIPYYLKGEIHGVIKIDSRDDITEHKTLVEGLVRIYSNHLYLLDESEHDKLTGLLNRRAFEKKLHRLLLLQRNHKKELDPLAEHNQRQTADESTEAWLAVIDIDFFKRVNDEWGHLIGDEILLGVARLMKEAFRKSDLLFRFGGEEFVVMLEPTPEDKAFMVFERFRTAIQEFTFPKTNNITVSVGFARLTKTDFPADIIERADKALYYVKEHGRNQVAHYEALVKEGKLKPRTDFDPIEMF